MDPNDRFAFPAVSLAHHSYLRLSICVCLRQLRSRYNGLFRTGWFSPRENSLQCGLLGGRQ